MKAKFVYLIGPTSVGKGYIVKTIMEICAILIARLFLKIEIISFGQIIRDLLEKDATFKEKYGQSIAKGDLLPDHEAIRIFQTQIDNIKASGKDPDFIIVDGFCRSTDQIAYAYENGFLHSKDQVFVVEASLEVCLERFLRRNHGNEKRIDSEMETFKRRYHLHLDTISALRNTFGEYEVPVIDIDANENNVAGIRVVSHFLAHAARMVDFQRKRKHKCTHGHHAMVV